MKGGAADGNTIAQWAATGKEKFKLEAADAAKDREPLVIVFPGMVSRPTVRALRAAGFRW